VIVMVRDAQLPQLRPLMRMMDSIDPRVVVTLDAEDLLGCEAGALVLLLVREEQLDWLNLNRPVFAQRSLRVVLWVEAALSNKLKLESPDLHDWISHFVTCPPGVPEFALEGLRIGMQWWPGVAWQGPGLAEALAELGIDPVEVRANSSSTALRSDMAGTTDFSLRWRGVWSKEDLWRVRWSLARARHTGISVLDHPSVGVPGWFPVSSVQIALSSLVLGLEAHQMDLRSIIAVELELAQVTGSAVSERTGVDSGEPSRLERTALLEEPGPLLRKNLASPEVVAHRRALVAEIRSRPTEPWSSREVAIFASLERDSIDWPEFSGVARKLYNVEHFLRFAQADEEVPESLTAAEECFRNIDLWGGAPVDVYEAWSPISSSEGGVSAESIVSLGDDVGWDVPRIAFEVGQAAATLLDEPALLSHFLKEIKSAAFMDLSPRDPAFVRLSWVESIALALAGDVTLGRKRLEALPGIRVGDQLDAFELDLAALALLSSDYSVAAETLRLLPTEPGTWALDLYMAALMAMGEPEQASAELQRITGQSRDPREFLGEQRRPHAIAREFLLQRLRSFT